ncbi:TIGR01777 family protein [Pseudanabaena sp. FACHB-1998]|uniref:thylakoid membrane protein ThyD n=1 Tax=Pseudanabaena sp. FACHB-1998 TaxID=2692858 RepID=UPI001680708E|nr:TIGR01777 family oxidoreductase [Pseudanabaena sp. FACHB-1998]MBD2175337.1 TIGR01777 family protein [Pseudanabaena sp. FACHB-1998]
MKIVVTGATGFVGVKLVERLHALGDRIVVLARNSQKANRQFPQESFPNVEVIGYNPLELGDWTKVVSGCEAVINLAGEPLAGVRWTDKRKQEIRDSRILTTKVLVEAIAKADVKPQVLISGSAIGYYGTSLTKDFDEYSYAGSDFLANVCKDWEAAAEGVSNLGVRLVKLRTGIVLGMGGALAKMLPIFQVGGGGKIGSGKQWFSWVHRDDLVELIIFAVKNNQIIGAVNATAPQPVTNEDFTVAFSKAIKRPAFLPVPAAALILVFGEGATVLLDGQKVLPKKAEINQFAFKYPQIEAALGQIFS